MLKITVPAIKLTNDMKLLRRILGQAGREIAATARSLIGRSAGGRLYAGRRASAPGQPPMTLSGLLQRSIKVKPVKNLRVSVVDGLFYAKMLESGAHGGGGKKGSANIGRVHKRGQASTGKPQTARVMLPRPFLSTAAEAELPRLERRIQQALAAGIDLKVLKAQGR